MALRKRKAPEPIASTLGALIDRLDSEGHFAIVRLISAWPEVVGEAVARRTEIVGLKFHTAVVKVSGAMWIQELNLLKPQILDRLRARIGDDAVRDLRFVQGRLSRRQPRTRLRPVPRDRAARAQGPRAAPRLREPHRGLGPRLALAQFSPVRALSHGRNRAQDRRDALASDARHA